MIESKPCGCDGTNLDAERYRWMLMLEIAEQDLNAWTSHEDHAAHDALPSPETSATLEAEHE